MVLKLPESMLPVVETVVPEADVKVTIPVDKFWVVALPVDYQTAHRLQWTAFDLVEGAQNWNKALHELVGLLAYRITGKI